MDTNVIKTHQGTGKNYKATLHLTKDKKYLSAAAALAGQTGGAIWVVLDFFAPLFASRQKVEKEMQEYLKQLHLF